MIQRIQIRRDTAANFTAANTLLALGEPALEIDTRKEKIGDGVTLWSALPYRKDSELSLGESVTTAYRGDRGKAAYDHSVAFHAPTDAQKNSDITKTEIEVKLTGQVTTHSHTVSKADVGLSLVPNTDFTNAVAANTSKVGITTNQANAITTNTAKVGITPTQASDITANNAKVGISTAQSNAIIANTVKIGITAAQASDIANNKAKISYTDAAKVAGIEVGAEKNIKSDWNATGGASEILNKPILGDETLPLTSTIVSNSQVLLSHVGGMNQVNSTTDITLTVQTFANQAIPNRTPILYQQKGEGNIYIAYAGGVTGPAVKTYAKGQTIIILSESTNIWDSINPPQAPGGEGITNGLESTQVGETMTVIPYTNFVGVYEKDYDIAKKVAGTFYAQLPDPPVVTMADFGPIISGWDMEEFSGTVLGTSPDGWTDKFGTNNLTKFTGANLELKEVSGIRQIRVSGTSTGCFVGGQPTNLDFRSNTHSFTLVAKLGELELTSGFMSIISWSSIATANNQYNLTVANDRLTLYVGDSAYVRKTSLTLTPNDTIAGDYNHITGVANLYRNGVLITTSTIIAPPVNVTDYGFGIGARANTYGTYNGGLRGAWVYGGIMTAGTHLGINEHLNS